MKTIVVVEMNIQMTDIMDMKNTETLHTMIEDQAMVHTIEMTNTRIIEITLVTMKEIHTIHAEIVTVKEGAQVSMKETTIITDIDGDVGFGM